MRSRCDVCHCLLIDPVGPLSAEILLVGEYPGYEEVRQGAPFVGKTGDVLREELARVGIQYTRCRSTNLWLHDKTNDCNIDYHIKMLVAEMYARKYVLLMGSDVTKALLGTGVMDWSGLQVNSQFIPDHIKAMACPNPASVFKGRVGEVRLAFKKFAEMIRKDN